MEIVPENVSEIALKEEATLRASRAGYCSRSGEPLKCTKIYTTVPFGKTKLNLWPRDKDGNLIDD